MSFADIGTEKVADWWDQRPCNIRASSQPVGTRAYFDEVEDRKYRVEPHIPDFANFHRWMGKKVLEIGTGLGTDTMNFARSGAWVTGVDISQQSVDLAKQRADVYGLSVDLFQCDAEHLTDHLNPLFPYDLVYSFGVIHHSPHPDRILREAAQLMRRGATLKIMVYHRRSWKVAWALARYGWRYRWNVDRTIAGHSEAQSGCPITYSYTRAQARQLVEEAGFKVTDIHVDHIFPYRIRDYKRGELVKTWYWQHMPQRAFRWLEHRIGWHLLITAVKP